ncbi:DUF6318 family protein [Glutamicibacter protophormiae]|uniref:DUF6318 family protein n=1 Tax=Glutamicibacter protophormiae TaxID=37930 RepID=UPI003BAEE156
MSARKIACVALLAAGSIALAACDSGSTAPPTQTSAQSQDNQRGSSAPSETSTSAPKEYKPATSEGPAENVPVPKLPAQASENSAEGAASFAEYYFELINYLVESNDSNPIKKVTSRSCEVCGKSLIDPAARAQVSGKWQVGGGHTFKVVDSFISSKNKAAVSMVYSVASAKFYIRPNELVSTEKSTESMRLSLVIEYDDGWQVQKIVFAEDRE